MLAFQTSDRITVNEDGEDPPLIRLMTLPGIRKIVLRPTRWWHLFANWSMRFTWLNNSRLNWLDTVSQNSNPLANSPSPNHLSLKMASRIATPKVALFSLILCLFNTIGKAENPSLKSTDNIDPSLIEALLTPVRPKQQNVNSPADTLPPSKVPHSRLPRPSKPLLRQQQPAEKRRPKVVKGKTL